VKCPRSPVRGPRDPPTLIAASLDRALRWTITIPRAITASAMLPACLDTDVRSRARMHLGSGIPATGHYEAQDLCGMTIDTSTTHISPKNPGSEPCAT
jgi:hypothetical protein